MSESKPIIQISKQSLLKAFTSVDKIPALMEKEMQDVQPLTHLLSKYVIRPIAFDANPYILPKSAQFVKYGGKNAYHKKMAAQEKYKEFKANQQSAEESNQFRKQSSKSGQVEDFKNSDEDDFDDFETVAEKKKVVRPPVQKVDTSKIIPASKMVRKTSDADQAPITRVHRKSSDVADTAQKKAAKPSVEVKEAEVAAKPVEEETIEGLKPKAIQKEEPKQAQVAQPGKKNKPKKSARGQEETKEKPKEVPQPKVEPKPEPKPEPKVEEQKVEEPQQPQEKKEEKKAEPQEAPQSARSKGPKPRGMAKFKPVKAEEAAIDASELSTNQKKKIEERKAKQEAEEKAKKEAEEKERQQKQKEIFEGMAAAQQKNQQKQMNASNFMDIMNEQDTDSRKKKVQEEARFKKMNQQKEQGFNFNYIGAGEKPVSKETLAGAATQEQQQVKGKNRKKK